MLIVIALGGNALLERGQTLTAEAQRSNVGRAVASIADIIEAGHQVVISHGNGPQIGLLALQEKSFPLDVLGAETEGGIGYVIERELRNILPQEQQIATLITQALVNPLDPAFENPGKPIGPLYDRLEGERLASEQGWIIKPDGNGYRRVVPSPKPRAILEIGVIQILIERGVVVVCGGGGGVPIMRGLHGQFVGVEAVIDKDWASALIAQQLKANALLLLTDVDGVFKDWDTARTSIFRRASASEMKSCTFAEGSMGPKVEAACWFVECTGKPAGIGKLKDGLAILNGAAGTWITS